jgi:hypothetical protein
MRLCFPHSIPYFVLLVFLRNFDSGESNYTLFLFRFLKIELIFYFVFLNEYGKHTSGLHKQALSINFTVLSVKQPFALKILTV